MTSHEESNDDSRYLLFWLGDELFGTPLMGVREVVELQKVKPIPHTIKSYLGVINIRGEIVGTIDLRSRMGMESLGPRSAAMIVFETTGGPIAAVADRLDGVAKIGVASIDTKARIESKIGLEYLIGVGKMKDRLVTLIDLKRVLDAEEIATVKSGILELGAA